MREKTEQLADDMGLDFVTITEGINGYPKNLYKAVINFDEFEDAVSFAEEINGEVVLLSKIDGYQFWNNNGRVSEGLDVTKFIDTNTEYNKVFDDELDFEEWCCDEIEYQLRSGFNLFDLKDKLEQMCETYDDIRTKCDSEYALVDINDYTCSMIDKYPTCIHDNDVTTYCIAVIENKED